MTLEFRSNGGRSAEQNFVLTCIGMGSRGWAFDWYKSQPPSTPLIPKIGDLKTPINDGQTVADAETL